MSHKLEPIIAASNINKGDHIRLVHGIDKREARVRTVLSNPSFVSSSIATITTRVVNNFANGNGVAVDREGNVYTTGAFAGTIQFGEYTLSSTNTSIYIVKQDPYGKVLYAKWATATQIVVGAYIMGDAIAIDKHGNVYVAGQFTGTFSFGNYTISSVGPSNYVSAFVVKLDPKGNALFAVNSVLNSQYASAAVYDIAVNDDAIYITGAFGYTVNFGSYSLSTNTGNVDLFIASLDHRGNFTHAVTGLLGSNPVPGSATGHSIAVDSRGDVYMAGFFQSSITLGSIVLQGVSYSINLLIAKLDSTLNFLNAITAVNSDASSASATALAVGTNGVYVTGFYIGTVAFGSISKTTIAVDGNMFLAIYDSNLNLRNVSTSVISDSTSFAYGNALTIDSSGSVFLAGILAGTVVFGSNTITSVAGNGGTVFISRLSPQGNFLSTIASVINDNSYAYVASITADDQGQLYIVGSLSGTVIFGSQTLNVPQSQGNMFMVQLSNDILVKLSGLAPESVLAGTAITPIFSGKVRKICSGKMIPSFSYVDGRSKHSLTLPGDSKYYQTYAGTAYNSKLLIAPH